MESIVLVVYQISEINQITGEGYICKGGNSDINIEPLLPVGIYTKMKEFIPLGLLVYESFCSLKNKLFALRIEPFSDRALYSGKQTGVKNGRNSIMYTCTQVLQNYPDNA